MFGSQFYNERTSWDEIKSVLEVMEAGDWTSVYTYDHFVPPWGGQSPDVRRSDSLPTLEGWSLLAAIAAVTTKLDLGVLVSGVTYRNPALMAKMAATMDNVSHGRMMLGIGAGWNVREHQAYGWEFPPLKERSDRLEEACELIHLLFHAKQDELLDYNGKYYQLNQAPFAPACYRTTGPRGRYTRDAIPIMVGGTGPKRTLKTLAKYGDIMNVIASPDQFRHHCEVLDKHCEDIDRDPAEITRTAHLPIRVIHDEKQAKEARGDSDWAMLGSPQYVIDRIGDFIEAGVQEFCFASIPQKPHVYQELNEDILPAFDPKKK